MILCIIQVAFLVRAGQHGWRWELFWAWLGTLIFEICALLMAEQEGAWLTTTAWVVNAAMTGVLGIWSGRTPRYAIPGPDSAPDEQRAF